MIDDRLRAETGSQPGRQPFVWSAPPNVRTDFGTGHRAPGTIHYIGQSDLRSGLPLRNVPTDRGTAHGAQRTHLTTLTVRFSTPAA